jgi:hypothetical protein
MQNRQHFFRVLNLLVTIHLLASRYSSTKASYLCAIMRLPPVHEACFILAFDRSARLAAGVYCFCRSTATTAWNNIFVIGLPSWVVVLSGLVWSISTFGSDCLHSFSRLMDEHIIRFSFAVSGRSPMVCLSVCVSFLLSIFCLSSVDGWCGGGYTSLRSEFVN